MGQFTISIYDLFIIIIIFCIFEFVILAEIIGLVTIRDRKFENETYN